MDKQHATAVAIRHTDSPVVTISGQDGEAAEFVLSPRVCWLLVTGLMEAAKRHAPVGDE